MSEPRPSLFPSDQSDPCPLVQLCDVCPLVNCDVPLRGMKWDIIGLLSLFSENLRLLWRGWRGCRWHETLANHGASGGRGKHLPSSYSPALCFSTGYATFASVLTDYILLELPIENALYPFSPWLTNHFDHCGVDLRHFVTCSCCCFCRLQMNQEFFCIQICVSFLFENLILKWVKREAYVFLAFSACVSIYRSTKQSIFIKKELVGWTKNLECHHWYKVGMCVDHINSSLDM